MPFKVVWCPIGEDILFWWKSDTLGFEKIKEKVYMLTNFKYKTNRPEENLENTRYRALAPRENVIIMARIG